MSVISPAASSLRDWIPGTRDLLIDGTFASPQGERWPVYNPATEQVIATVGGASAEQVDAAVAAARGAFPGWAALSGEQRSRHIHRLADVLEAAADELLPSIVNEVGTPVSLASFLQVRMAVQQHLRWAAEAAKADRIQHLGP
jgi:aldehyde dehydrogenase (NAD+)/betaine-aldehyde dehydrogenase